MRLQTFEPNVFGLYKPAGWTPLQALLELKRVRPELADIPLTYAGRLDPMAEGLLLVLGGEKVHEKDTYLGLDKTYTVTALLGIETDSFDLLGMPKAAAHTCNKLGSIRKLDSEVGEKDGASEAKVREVLNSYVGQTTLPLPLYSSPPVDGRPLFQHAQQSNIAAKDTPRRTTTIFSCDLDRVEQTNAAELLSYTCSTIALVHGEFRQSRIVEAWEQLLSSKSSLPTITFTIHCSSGTYVRSLVQDLGTQLENGACVLRLVRTQVGPYTLQ